MESDSGNPTAGGAESGAAGGSRSYRRRLSSSNLIQVSLTALLEHSGILRNPRFNLEDSAPLVAASVDDEVSARIVESNDQDSNARVLDRVAMNSGNLEYDLTRENEREGGQEQGRNVSNLEGIMNDNESSSGNTTTNNNANSSNNRTGSRRQRYDIQTVAKWIEQILPYSLLFLVVFIRQHLQGFFFIIWLAPVMFKSNDILKKQTALKGERKTSMLVMITLGFMVLILSIYRWYKDDDLFYPLVLLPPKDIPPFWHALFTIVVNDAMVRQAVMVLKCILLMYYKNSKGRNYRKQGQMLTLVEYLFLLYRALLPTPVWYRFFLNEEYGIPFSSLTTGIYLILKFTSVVKKAHSFFAALKALSSKEVHYGCYASTEQATAAGDVCAICQEKMHTPILLGCHHMFCEDCVSEWFERERTCPLCRALVKLSDLHSFGDGSTTLTFQIF